MGFVQILVGAHCTWENAYGAVPRVYLRAGPSDVLALQVQGVSNVIVRLKCLPIHGQYCASFLATILLMAEPLFHQAVLRALGHVSKVDYCWLR